MSSFSFSFRSDRPDLSSADSYFDQPGSEAASKVLARRYEEVINSPEFLDRNHRMHAKAVADARTLAETLYGDAPVGGFAGSGITIDTGTGEVVTSEQLLAQRASVADPYAIADEHSKAD